MSRSGGGPWRIGHALSDPVLSRRPPDGVVLQGMAVSPIDRDAHDGASIGSGSGSGHSGASQLGLAQAESRRASVKWNRTVAELLPNGMRISCGLRRLQTRKNPFPTGRLPRAGSFMRRLGRPPRHSPADGFIIGIDLPFGDEPTSHARSPGAGRLPIVSWVELSVAAVGPSGEAEQNDFIILGEETGNVDLVVGDDEEVMAPSLPCRVAASNDRAQGVHQPVIGCHEGGEPGKVVGVDAGDEGSNSLGWCHQAGVPPNGMRISRRLRAPQTR